MAAKKTNTEIEEKNINEIPDELEQADVILSEAEDEETVIVTEEDFQKEEQEIKKSEISEENAETFMEETLYADSFARRTVNIPGKRKMRNAFREEEEIIGDESGEIDTFAKMKKREYDILVDSAKSQKPKVLYGRIDGVEEIQVGNQKILEVIAHLVAADRKDLNTDRELTSSIYKIKIPAQMLAFYNHEKYDREESYDSLKVMINMRIKSIVEFVVYDVDPTEEVVLASSVTAKQLLQYDWYLGKRARIKPGAKAKGHITYINSKGILVNVMGAEVFIKNSELRWGFVNNPLEEKNNFWIGKSVPVRITSVETTSTEILGRKYPYVRITGSLKDATENPNKLYFDKYQEGCKYHGIIAYHLVTGEYIVKLGAGNEGLNGDGVMCMCKAPSMELGGTPYVGQEVNVIILSKNEEYYKIKAAFSYMAKN